MRTFYTTFIQLDTLYPPESYWAYFSSATENGVVLYELNIYALFSMASASRTLFRQRTPRHAV